MAFISAPRYACLWQTGWILDAVNWTDYNDRNNLDSLGATLRSSERMIWSLPVVADRVKIGHDKTACLALDLIDYSAPIKSELSFSLNRTLNNRNPPLYQYYRNQVLLTL